MLIKKYAVGGTVTAYNQYIVPVESTYQPNLGEIAYLNQLNASMRQLQPTVPEVQGTIRQAPDELETMSWYEVAAEPLKALRYFQSEANREKGLPTTAEWSSIPSSPQDAVLAMSNPAAMLSAIANDETGTAGFSFVTPYNLSGPLGQSKVLASNSNGAPIIEQLTPNPYVNITDRIQEAFRNPRFKATLNPRQLYDSGSDVINNEFMDWLIANTERRLPGTNLPNILSDKKLDFTTGMSGNILDDFTSKVLDSELQRLAHLSSLDYLDQYPVNMSLEGLNEAIVKLANQSSSGLAEDVVSPDITSSVNFQRAKPFLNRMVDHYKRTGELQPESIPLASRLIGNINEVAHKSHFNSGRLSGGKKYTRNNLSTALSNEYVSRFSDALNRGEGFRLGETPVFRGMNTNPDESSLSASFSSSPNAARYFGNKILIGNTRPDESVFIPNMFLDPRFSTEMEIMRNPLNKYSLVDIDNENYNTRSSEEMFDWTRVGENIKDPIRWLDTDLHDILRYRLLNQ